MVGTWRHCQGRALTRLTCSVRAPTGQTCRHSPQEIQASGFVIPTGGLDTRAGEIDGTGS